MQLHLKEWAELPSTLLSIENERDRKEITEKLIAQHPQIEGMVDSLAWMRKWTKTKDEQDPANAFKHFPESKAYHAILHRYWERSFVATTGALFRSTNPRWSSLLPAEEGRSEITVLLHIPPGHLAI